MNRHVDLVWMPVRLYVAIIQEPKMLGLRISKMNIMKYKQTRIFLFRRPCTYRVIFKSKELNCSQDPGTTVVARLFILHNLLDAYRWKYLISVWPNFVSYD